MDNLANLIDLEKDILKHPSDDLGYIQKLFDNDIFTQSDINSLREVFSMIVNNPKLSESEKNDYLLNSWKINFKAKPPTPDEFLTPEWIGDTAKGLYPYIPIWFNKFFDYSELYRNAIFYLPLGSGKSTLTVLMNLYLACHYNLMRNPRKFFNQAESAVMTLVIASFTYDKAFDILAKPMMNIMETSKKFERCRDEAKLKRMSIEGDHNMVYWSTAGQGSVIQISDLRVKQISDIANLLGLTVLMGSMTELAFFNDKGWSNEKIMRLYNDVRGRIFARFNNNHYARTILDSSPNSMENVIDRWIVNEAKDDPTNYILRGTKWDLQPQLFDKWNKDKSLVFPFYKGSSSKPSRVIDNSEDISKYDDRSIIYMPIDIYQLAKNDPGKILKDFAGEPTETDDTLISNVEIIEDIFIDHLPNLYGYIHVPASLPPEQLIWNLIKDQFFFNIRKNEYQFHRNPHAVRYLSVDQSEKNDWTGIAMCHVEIDTKGQLVYVVDFSICIVPTKEKINLEAIKFFIHDLQKYGKLNIHISSFDQFQSSSTIQYLERFSFEVTKLSVDRSTEPYLNFISAMQRGAIKIGKNIVLKNNFKSLIMGETPKSHRKKVDHNNGDIYTEITDDWDNCMAGRNMKDLSDAVVACVELANIYGTKNPQYIWKDIDKGEQGIIQLEQSFMKDIQKKYYLGV